MKNGCDVEGMLRKPPPGVVVSFYFEMASVGGCAVPVSLTPSVVAELHGSVRGAASEHRRLTPVRWLNVARTDVAFPPLTAAPLAAPLTLWRTGVFVGIWVFIEPNSIHEKTILFSQDDMK